MSFDAKFIDRILHQMHSAYGVLKTVVQRSRIHQVRQTELGNPAQSLKPRVIYEFKYEFMADGNEAINRVIDDFSFRFGDS
jgi:hypothetical protein